MIGAVLDANALAAGILWFGKTESPPALVLQAWVRSEFQLLVSQPLLDELTRTLAKPYFVARIDPRVHDELARRLGSHATLTTISVQVNGVASHPEDDLVLAAAVSANADFLVTGDKDLLALHTFRQFAIVSPREFLTELDRQAGR